MHRGEPDPRNLQRVLIGLAVLLLGIAALVVAILIMTR